MQPAAQLSRGHACYVRGTSQNSGSKQLLWSNRHPVAVNQDSEVADNLANIKLSLAAALRRHHRLCCRLLDCQHGQQLFSIQRDKWNLRNTIGQVREAVHGLPLDYHLILLNWSCALINNVVYLKTKSRSSSHRPISCAGYGPRRPSLDGRAGVALCWATSSRRTSSGRPALGSRSLERQGYRKWVGIGLVEQYTKLFVDSWQWGRGWT